MTSHYLGYSTHTDWLSAIDRSQPVNAISLISSEWGDGLAHNTHLIVLSQDQGETAHIFRLITDKYQSHDGHEPLDGNAKLHDARAESAWNIIQTWLKEQGLTHRRALLAIPSNLKVINGHADELMTFDKNLGWVFADRIDPAVLDAWGVPQPAAKG